MDTLHCYEFLLMKKIQQDPVFWAELKEKYCSSLSLFSLEFCELAEKHSRYRNQIRKCYGSFRYEKICSDLWFLAVALERSPHHLLGFLADEIRREDSTTCQISRDTVLSRYLSSFNFVEMHLDNIFKYGEVAVLPPELFKCKNIRLLSLKYNNLEWIPPDIGRMENLECLLLTNNRLQNRSIPYTLKFCSRLSELFLDNNLLDALPGCLLSMPQLSTVHRHGNHNYFKATFMWYHTDVNDRILRVDGRPKLQHTVSVYEPETLLFLAARAVIASKVNFFQDRLLPLTLQDYIAHIYPKFLICGNCLAAPPVASIAYKVFTFKNPYLGNTCVPFQHWACSFSCAKAIEVPAHVEQVRSAEKMDREYDNYVQELLQESGIKVPSRHCILL